MSGMSEGQSLAMDQLRELVAISSGAIQMPVAPAAPDVDGEIRAQISLDCGGTPAAEGGLRLRRRERFTVVIPRDFPFGLPHIWVPHRRWAGTPHVQWGSHLCLYAAPSVEWSPADGMFGLLERLTLWLQRAAAGELDPEDQPLHPPVAYASTENGVVVVKADLGDLAPPATPGDRRQRVGVSRHVQVAATPNPSHRLVVGIVEIHSNERCDIVEWVSRAEWLRRFVAGELSPTREGRSVAGSVAVLTDREMSFEYPSDATNLIAALVSLGVPDTDLFRATGEVAAVNCKLARTRAGTGPILSPDLNVFVGTPSRRLSLANVRQHLVCWRLDELGRLVAENLLFAGAEHPDLAEIGALAQKHLPDWVSQAKTSWVQVMEAREEVSIRRDADTSSEWIQGRRVMVLGCGALGAPIVEFCVRGGAASVHALDNDLVTPGILVRQPFTDADIGIPKAIALARHMNQIRSDAPVCPLVGSVQNLILAEGAPPPDVDLIIDATADSSVASLLELRRSRARDAWPPIVATIIGHDARRGVMTAARQGATGAGRHILRLVSLASREEASDKLGDVAADFFPIEPRTATFQPEPGCSSPTFTGSAADVAALAGHLFDAALRALASIGPPETMHPMVAAVVRLDVGSAPIGLPGTFWLGWPDDNICKDPDSGYEVRISQPALARMRAEVRRGARLRGPDVETGGLLLGQVDDACRCIWVDDVSGPPPDSLLSAVHFDHGVEGVKDLLAYHRKRSGSLTTFLGMWHSHPRMAATPSPTDKIGMQALVTPISDGPRRALITIVGGDNDCWTNWLDRNEPPDVFARLVNQRGTEQPGGAPQVPASHQRDGWPGGWASRPRSFFRPPRGRRIALLRRLHWRVP